jgi:FkbM family methyltransferase
VDRNLRVAVDKIIGFVGDVVKIEAVRLKQSSRGARVIQNMAQLCGDINTIVDVGASDGRWSEGVRACWPNANYLLVEAQDVHRSALAAYASSRPRTFVVNAAASDHVGHIHFDTRNPFGGEACAAPFASHDATLPCTTIDTELKQRALQGPYLIKLDTHGHEREILCGAEGALCNAGLLVIEAYNFAKPNRMYFWQLCALMEERGFRTAGLADPLMSTEGVLRQMDLCFMPRTNVCFDRPE